MKLDPPRYKGRDCPVRVAPDPKAPRMAAGVHACSAAIEALFTSEDDVDGRLCTRIANQVFQASSGWQRDIHAPVLRPFLQDLLQPLCVDSADHEQFLTFFHSSMQFRGWRVRESGEDLFTITVDAGAHTLYAIVHQALRTLLSVVFDPDWHRTVHGPENVPRALHRCFLRAAPCFLHYFRDRVLRVARARVHNLQFRVGAEFDFHVYERLRQGVCAPTLRAAAVPIKGIVRRSTPRAPTPQFYHPVRVVDTASPAEPVFNPEEYRPSRPSSALDTPVEEVDFFSEPRSPLLCAPTPTIPRIPIEHDLALLWTAFVHCRSSMHEYIERLSATSPENTVDRAMTDMRVLFPFFYNMLYDRTEPREFEFLSFFQHHLGMLRALAAEAVRFRGFLRNFSSDRALLRLYQTFRDANTVVASQDEPADSRSWQVLGVEETLHDCTELYARLMEAYVFFEAQALQEFLSAHSAPDQFVALRMPVAVSRRRLSASVRRMLDTLPGLPEHQYLVVSTRAHCYLVIEVDCLQRMRLCMLGYVFNTYERAPKSLPVYPLLIRSYFMENGSSGDAGVWAVMNTLVHWCTKQKQVQAHVMEPSDELFGVYRLLHRVVARWRTVDRLTQALRSSYKAPGRWGLLRAVSSFIQLRRPHFIRGRTVQWLQRIFFLDGQRTDMLQRTYPRLVRIVHRLHRDTTRHDEHVALDEEQTGVDGAHLELYMLCTSQALSDAEGLDLFQSIYIDEPVQLRGPTRGIAQVMRFEHELRQYMGNFARSHSDAHSPFRRSTTYTAPAPVLSGREPVSLFCVFLRTMEWGAMHGADAAQQEARRGSSQQFRGALQDMQGPCELDPADLFEVCGSHRLPVHYDADRECAVPLEESFFLLTVPPQHAVLVREDDALGDVLTQYYGMDQERVVCRPVPMIRRMEEKVRHHERRTRERQEEEMDRENLEALEIRQGIARHEREGPSPDHLALIQDFKRRKRLE